MALLNLSCDCFLQESLPASVVTHLYCGVFRVERQVELPRWQIYNFRRRKDLIETEHLVSPESGSSQVTRKLSLSLAESPPMVIFKNQKLFIGQRRYINRWTQRKNNGQFSKRGSGHKVCLKGMFFCRVPGRPLMVQSPVLFTCT